MGPIAWARPGPTKPLAAGAPDGAPDAGDSITELLALACGPTAVPIADADEISAAGAGPGPWTTPEVVVDGAAVVPATFRSVPDPLPEMIGASGALGDVVPPLDEVPAFEVEPE